MLIPISEVLTAPTWNCNLRSQARPWATWIRYNPLFEFATRSSGSTEFCFTGEKYPNEKPLVQKALVTQENVSERVLVLMVPGEKKGEFTKSMQSRFVRRN